MKWKRDWGLYARMAGVFVLLAGLYIAFAGALALYFGEMFGIALAIGLMSCLQLLWGHKIALKAMGGRVVSDTDYPELHRRVQRLAQQADIPTPEVAVANHDAPNAFAAGRSRNTSVVCVTTGLVEALEGDELDAVLAHELAHIQHRDMVIMTGASALATMAFWVVRWGWLFDDGGAGGDGGGEHPHLWVAFAASLVVWVASFFVIRLLSRYREYAADRGAVSITGNPSALASALLTIDGQMDEVPSEDLRSQAGMNALLFDDVTTEDRLTKWFRTHPAVDDRVERLRTLERDI